MSTVGRALTVHVVDTLGDEGVVTDARVFEELSCVSAQVVTAVLAAGERGVDALERLSLGVVAQQFESALAAGPPGAARIGYVGDEPVARLLAELLPAYCVPGVVLAPLLRVGGVEVADDAARAAIATHLFPVADVVVLRAADAAAFVEGAERLTDVDGARTAAAAVRERGARRVLVAGCASRDRVLDLLDDEGRVAVYDASRIAAPRVPGLGGAHAAALAGHLARGLELSDAVAAAQRYVGFRLQRGR